MTKNPFSHSQPCIANLDNRQECLRKSNGSGQKAKSLVSSYSHIPFPDGPGAHAGEGQKDTQGVSGGGFLFLFLVGFCCCWLVVSCWLWFVFFFKKVAYFLMPSCNKLDL